MYLNALIRWSTVLWQDERAFGMEIDISNEINANSRTKFVSNEKFLLDDFL